MRCYHGDMSIDKINEKVRQSPNHDRIRFWFVRHEESEGNTLGEKSPVMHDTPLTEKGKQGGQRIARHLLAKHVRVTHVYSSDSQRGGQTAQYIAEAFHAPLVKKPELNERDWGELRGLPWKEV